jgi:hypothetical protein
MSRFVTLVTGPPCGGKSTLVERLKSPDDVVVDFDEVARRLGSPVTWMHAPRYVDAAEREVARLMDRVAAMPTGQAWVIRCVPDPDERTALAGRLAADRTLVVKPPMMTAMVRAHGRPTPRLTKRAITQWYSRYAPAPGDELVAGVAVG